MAHKAINKYIYEMHSEICEDIYKENNGLVDIEDLCNTLSQYDILNDKMTYMLKTSHLTSLSIPRFVEDKKCFDNVSFTSPDNFNKQIAKIAENYAEWVSEKMQRMDIGISIEHGGNIYLDIVNFFKGEMGEYFWSKYLSYADKIYVKNKNGREVSYAFRNVTYHCLKDFGIDLVCEVSIDDGDWHNAVIQVKNWAVMSKYANVSKGDKYIITDEIVQKAYSQGVGNHFIPVDNNAHDIFVCWFGDDEDVSRQIEEDPIICDRTAILNKRTIKKDPNCSRKIWDNILKDVKELAKK